MPTQKRPPPPPPPSPSPSAAPGAGSPPPSSPPLPTAEPAEKKPKLEVNGSAGAEANGNANDFGAKEGTEVEASESESEDADAAKQEFVPVKLSDVRKEVQCPICLGIIRKTRTVMECLHRFCRECIDKSMRLGNNECPACRTHCASRRSLRDDPNYDALIAALYPDIDKYEEEELAFNEEENDRNKQIQASIAEAFRKQSEVIGRKSTAKATAAAFVRRSRRNIRPNGQNTYFRGRGKASSDDVALACSEDEEDGNGESCSKEASSAEESSPEKKQKRLPKWPTPRSSPARACNDEVASDEKDDVGISRENFSTSPLRAWGKNGTRSQTRHSSFSGSNGRMVKGGRMIKLVECLRNSDDNEGERDVHLCLLPLDGQTAPNLEKSYLCCGPTLSIKQLCQFVASQTSHKDEEVEMYALKPSCSKPVSTNTCGPDKARLAGEERLSDLRSSFTFPNGVLELVYAIKVAN
ncbi:putative E3 ubiquitin-protein ligase RING1a [Zea mays]|uniref:Putative E3 ubiquitin-protein ligase RING1a n=4 Tax=Zea mays TaxID=4577 RepID=A0A1D6KQK3_MAIZE|nr:Putative E3 ubiquitin-protein ligase RING1a [Zea mays]PWZ56071.1 putative E3 ubiquitin-protein ligase RING1a [Zea mays]